MTWTPQTKYILDLENQNSGKLKDKYILDYENGTDNSAVVAWTMGAIIVMLVVLVVILNHI